MVYVANTSVGRVDLWESMLQIKRQMISPWLVLSEVNVVLNEDEKMVEQGPVTWLTNELQNFLDSAYL